MMKRAADLQQGQKFLVDGVEQQLAYRVNTSEYSLVRLVLVAGHSITVAWDRRFTLVA